MREDSAMTEREAVERFHLVFLRHFAATISPGTICLKGGVNLRLFLNSPRLSEDIDFDARVVAVGTLKKNVEKVLAGRPLLSELAAAQLTLSEIRPSKQTPTSQRWKLHVIHENKPLPTRLEFSRRDGAPFEPSQTEPPSAAILALHQVTPFVFHHYTAPAAYRQKIHALATRSEVQARDVFDLNHLSPHAIAAREAPADEVKQAITQLGLITFPMFNTQVVPFLPLDLAEFYGTNEAWTKLSDQVRNDLMSALPTVAQ